MRAKLIGYSTLSPEGLPTKEFETTEMRDMDGLMGFVGVSFFTTSNMTKMVLVDAETGAPIITMERTQIDLLLFNKAFEKGE